MTSLRERHKSLNTMLCLLQGMVGTETTVEFRNEDTAHGKIVRVDGFMNIDMENVMYRNHSGCRSTFESLYVQGKNIRFVRIPDDVNIRHTMTKQLKVIQGVRTNTERGVRSGLSKEDKKQLKEDKIKKRIEATRTAAGRAQSVPNKSANVN